jgi:MFS family permease
VTTIQPPRHDPWEALRQPGFQLLSAGRLASAMAAMLLQATIFWQVYHISGSEFQLAMLGVAQFIPSLGLSLLGGAVADRYNRQFITITAQLLAAASGAVLLVVTAQGNISVAWVYGMALIVGVSGAFEWPSRQALLPMVVSRESFANAITVSSTFQQLGFVTGPAIAGFAIAWKGPELGYGIYCGLFAVSVLTLVFLRPSAVETPKRAVSLAAVGEGVRFVVSRQAILGAMTLDMFAVIFGGAAALLPVYADKILDVGDIGYGLLAASLDLGALLTSIALIFCRPIRRTGRALLIAVTFYGLATIAFGFSRSFPLSLAAYAFIGVADQVSVVCRQTTIQLNTPDHLRGRVTSVNMLFIGASNRLGAVESGLVASITSATFAVVSGGIGCLAVLGIVSWKMPGLRRYQIGAPTVEPLPAPAQDEVPAPAAGGSL